MAETKTPTNFLTAIPVCKADRLHNKSKQGCITPKVFAEIFYT
jgi:hypothetical protein